MERALTRSAMAVAATVLLFACSYRHHAYRLDEKSKVPESTFDLHFVEADDEGWFWQPSQATKALEAVQQSADERNTFVLLFVHGWHHSARCCDNNVQSFKKALTQLHDELRGSTYEAARTEYSQADKSDPGFKLIGIYVGWRGKSLPGVLDYSTFWGRKGAAERVGETDVREFIARLNRLYLDHRSLEKRETFLGLISIGHSFGAQVLMRATASTFEQQLISLNAPPGYLRQSETTPAPTKVTLQGIGDLVILLNPATEAAAYQRLHLLSMGLQYESTQTPVILTLSAENDKARHSLFTIGRRVGEFFTGKPHKENELEREAERKALGVDGEFVKHVTHRIQPVDERERLVTQELDAGREAICADDGVCAATWQVWADLPDRRTLDDTLSRDDPQSREQLRDFDFSSEIRLGNVEMKPVTGFIPYQPLIVASSSKAVIDDHSGIFTEPLLRFLTRYIALIESKIALNPKEDREQKQRALAR